LPCLRHERRQAKPHPSSFPESPTTIGEHIRKRRAELGLFQMDVAKQLKVSDESINNWENGHTTPQINLMPRIISFLGYNPLEFKDNSVEQKIYAYRCANGLSHKRLGKLLNVDASTVQSWEQGKRLPAYKMLMLVNNY
jgi:DNA-binding transcriptional regulator YiaG